MCELLLNVLSCVLIGKIDAWNKQRIIGAIVLVELICWYLFGQDLVTDE